MSPEQRAGSGILVQETPHGQGDRLGLVAIGQLFGRFLDEGDDIGPVDGDDVWHVDLK